MRAFICRTPDVDAVGVEQLLVLMNSKPGPIRFQNAGEVEVKSDLGANGETLFRKDAYAAMVEVRQAHKLDDEDALVLRCRNERAKQGPQVRPQFFCPFTPRTLGMQVHQRQIKV